MKTSQVDWHFIGGEEGNKSRGYVPNIVYNGNITSGVTIGKGFDLGSKTKNSLVNEYGLPNNIVEKLEPYLGVKGQKAINALASPDYRKKRLDSQGERGVGSLITGNSQTFYDPVSVLGKGNKTLRWEKPIGDIGLELNESELSVLDDCVRRRFLSVVINHFRRDSSRQKLSGFETLPATVQTALMSICFNMGENISLLKKHKRERKLWNAFVIRDYQKVIEILIEFSNDPIKKSLSARRLKEVDLVRKGMIGPLSFEPEFLIKMEKYSWISRLG